MRNAALALLSGILLALAFPPLSLWPLAWVAPGLLYTLLTGPKPATLAGYLFGVALFLLGAQWVRALAVPLWLLMPIFPVSLFALYGLINGFLLVRLPVSVRPVAFALLWALFEWARGLGTYAAPWFSLANAHAHPTALPFLQSVSLIGTPGLGFLVALTSALLTEGIRRRERRFALALLIPAVLLAAPRPTENPHRALHLALIQPGHADSHALKDYLDLSRQAALRHPDAIVWPEGAASELTAGQLAALARELRTPLLVGFYQDYDDGPNHRPQNLALLFDGEGQERGRYAKQRLAPFGEVYPFQSWIRGVYASFGIRHDSFRHGERPGVLTLPTGQKIGVGICFESAFPWVAHHNAKEGAQLLIFLTSDQAFGRSAALAQHRDMAVVRAVENRLPVVQVASTGITTLITPEGTCVAALAPGERGILFVHAILPK